MTGTIEAEDVVPPADARIISPEPSKPEQLSLPSADPVARLRNMMRERQDESVKILSGWIDNKENAH